MTGFRYFQIILHTTTSTIATSTPTQITLVSNDGTSFVIDSALISSFSGLIRDLLEDLDDTSDPIPIFEIKGDILKRFLDWCEHHQNDAPEPLRQYGPKELSAWDKEFFNTDVETQLEIMLAVSSSTSRDSVMLYQLLSPTPCEVVHLVRRFERDSISRMTLRLKTLRRSKGGGVLGRWTGLRGEIARQSEKDCWNESVSDILIDGNHEGDEHQYHYPPKI